MDISGISNGLVKNTIDSTKKQVAEDIFERHLTSAMDKNDEKELKKACQEFEGILLDMMYKQMKATVPKSDLIPSDIGNDIFQSMLDEKLVEEASTSNSFGLGDILYKQLSKKLMSTYKPSNEGE